MIGRKYYPIYRFEHNFLDVNASETKVVISLRIPVMAQLYENSDTWDFYREEPLLKGKKGQHLLFPVLLCCETLPDYIKLFYYF
jgi:hypothetical protein